MDDHWFPYVIREFTKQGIKVVAKNFPDSFLARRKYWIPFLENELSVDKYTIMIGHSSGAEAAMRFAENHKIYGTVLISPCYTDMGIKEETISGWYDGEWLWEKIKANQNFIIQFSSRDDPVVPISEQDYVRGKLQPEYHELESKGHFNGMREFPELIEVVMDHLRA